MSWEDQLAADRSRIEARLAAELTQSDELDAAARYAVLLGGKRIRAHLVYEGARLNGVDDSSADAAAMAIELLHAYSLVHDDLPAMDNDDLRRGKPTVHKQWNEWTAILVGDLLQSRAFEILARAAPTTVGAFAVAASNMVRGQFQDLSAENAAVIMTQEEIERLQKNKTGALIEWSAMFGALAAHKDPQPYRDYAAHLGAAFQIWDDVLDVESNEEELGKAVGKDQSAGKATFLDLLGLDNAKARARDHVRLAQDAIESVDREGNLRALSEFVIRRRN